MLGIYMPHMPHYIWCISFSINSTDIVTKNMKTLRKKKGNLLPKTYNSLTEDPKTLNESEKIR